MCGTIFCPTCKYQLKSRMIEEEEEDVITHVDVERKVAVGGSIRDEEAHVFVLDHCWAIQ